MESTIIIISALLSSFKVLTTVLERKNKLQFHFIFTVRHFTNESLDITGTNDSCKHAYFIEKEWNSLGLNTVEVKRYDVLFSYPKKPRELSLVDETGQVVSSSIFVKRGIHDLGGVPFSTYSTSGVAMGKLLYVNYGRENDFKYLDDSNISSTGKLVLLRYGKILESAKVPTKVSLLCNSTCCKLSQLFKDFS